MLWCLPSSMPIPLRPLKAICHESEEWETDADHQVLNPGWGVLTDPVPPQKKNPPGGRKTMSQIHLLGGRSPASFTITMMSNARASCAIGISSAKRTHACAEDHG